MKNIVVVGIVFSKKKSKLEKIAILHESGIDHGKIVVKIGNMAEKYYKKDDKELHIKFEVFNTEKRFYAVIESEDINEEYFAIGFGDEVEEAVNNAEDSLKNKMNEEGVPKYSLVD